MDEIATASRRDRANLFDEVARDPAGVLPGPVATTIVEKDFWVCWILRELFRLPASRGAAAGGPRFLFKGGTSLSKGFGLIQRFSEDVDLTIAPEVFGAATPRADSESRSRRDRRLRTLADALANYVSTTLRAALQGQVESDLGRVDDWIGVDPEDPASLRFVYPQVTDGTGYLLPHVKLEFGARSEREPHSVVTIRSYVAARRSDVTTAGGVDVPILRPERTFWEKATILHAENGRPVRAADAVPRAWHRITRHAADLVAMAPTPIAAAAIGDLELLRRVCRTKARFFDAGYVDYEGLDGSNLELVPRGSLAAHFAADFDAMRPMFFGVAPTLTSVLDGLAELQARVRASVPRPRDGPTR